MLKHRNIVILFICGIITLVFLNRTYTIHWSLYLFLFLVFLIIEFYGAYFIHSNFHIKAICKVKTKDKVVALSFDDGPVLQTEKVLKVLDEFNVKATFFCIGNRIKGNEEILKKISAKGHLIGNHSYSHGYFIDLKNTTSFVNELELANKIIHETIGKTPTFFRPPYGVTTPALARATKKLNMDVIGWNIRSLDTSIKNPQKVLERIKERLQPGSIVLMHDTVIGIEIVLKELLTYLKDQNYTVIALDQLLEKKAYV
ncbi:polysaccharide deacetylase family protein [Aurantibacillus circumpalustris]|uniref:polysaccharide deacetylase family protein n=1 Tax=Aurantibacillus circumpalustris TaxID=3036359 RepID=UPI00295AC35B|nr:polysaccharide deacetylase family protein [Aurantibacillus circumpalustris]